MPRPASGRIERRNEPARRGQVQLCTGFLYNPVWSIRGLSPPAVARIAVDPAELSDLLRGHGSRAGSRTLEQLLMSPASTSEIIIAKVTPLSVAVPDDVPRPWRLNLHSGVPFHGNVCSCSPVARCASCLASSISTVVSTFSKSAQQAQLTTFSSIPRFHRCPEHSIR